MKFLTLFALLFGAGLQMLLPRGRRWIQSRLTLLVLLGFIHGLLFWDGDILLAYGLVGLICWRLVLQMPRELSAPFQAIGYASLFYGFWPQLSRFKLVLAIACVGRMALTNYLLQTLICTTLFYHLGLFMQYLKHQDNDLDHIR